jgi:hypothetical protein
MAKSERARKGGGKELALTINHQVSPATGSYNADGTRWFGAGEAPSVYAPDGVKGRAFDFPVGYNQISTPRAYEPISFAVLRAFADNYDLLRLIIETRKDQMARLRWAIQLREPKEGLTPQKRNKIKELQKFFRRPDGENTWSGWLRMLLEDLFVIDAPTLHRRRTRGGKLMSLDQIDGATIKVVLDDDGRTPEDENDTAYQQVLHGIPAVNYLKSEILYEPRNKRVHKVYGFSPVEQILMTINIALRRQIYQLNFFTEGNVPAALIGVPDTWTPDQIRVFQEWFDGVMSGNLGEKRKARFVPSAVGKTYVPTQETELFGKAEEWLARVICFAFSVSPQPFMMMMNRSTADTAQQTSLSEGMAPIQAWVKDQIDFILEFDLGAEDYEFVWKGDDELDPVRRQQISSGYLKDGLITVNEGRADMGRDPYDDPIFDQPMAMTSNGLAPLVGPGSNLQGNTDVDGDGSAVDDKVPQGKDGKGINLSTGGAGSSVQDPVQFDGPQKDALKALLENDPDAMAQARHLLANMLAKSTNHANVEDEEQIL